MPSLRAMASEVARMMKLCLPVTTYGPFCSTPPVGMMTVVLPAFSASRTSCHVNSSVNSDAFGSGFFGAGPRGRGGAADGDGIASAAARGRTQTRKWCGFMGRLG